ncbi:MAG: PD40 domain-containing protein [Armatimonadetes bacterium]|nr:PD40 domain-containing protein [Armatimonadota bacterium]MDE2205012.1 PD40 domain-containing protein [Armatimonadota bacterium]
MIFASAKRATACLVLLTAISARNGSAQAVHRHFLRKPDIHGDAVVFTAEGDLWLGSISRHTARRVTSAPGLESDAKFSPDGMTIAFTAQYDGPQSVYTMPTAGGVPKRLTWFPGPCTVLGWTPDGKSVIFHARRRFLPMPEDTLYRVPAAGGPAVRFPLPRGHFGALNADGTLLAYVPISAEWQHWFRYQGGQADKIWLCNLQSHAFTQLTNDLSIDTEPIWVGNTIYFVSERSGSANLFRMSSDGRHQKQVTFYKDYPVRYPSTDGKHIIYEHGDGLAVFNPATGNAYDLTMHIGDDRIHARPFTVPVAGAIDSVAPGPTGKRVVIEARGQLLSAPAKSGDIRLLAPLPGSRSQFPVWSPDGKLVAFDSDRSGEEEIWVTNADGTGSPKQLTTSHKGPLSQIVWSPDSKWLAAGDREMRIMLVNVSSGATTVVDQADRSGSYDTTDTSYRFSPDSKWLTFNRFEANWNQGVYLYNIASGQKVRVTDPVMNCYGPRFSPDGKYLLFLADRQFDTMFSGASHFFDFDKTTRISMLPLAADTASPFLPKDDEEPVGKPASDAKPAAVKPKTTEPVVVKVDLTGIQNRIIDVPIGADHYGKVVMNGSRLLMMVGADDGQPNRLVAYDIKKKTTTTLTTGLDDFTVTADGKKLLVQRGRSWQFVAADTGAFTAGAGAISVAGALLHVDPVAEWKQILNESWRIIRDLFYDPNLYGIDWNAVHRKYLAELPAVADRSDLTEILADMLAELNTGHCFVFGGSDGGQSPPNEQDGWLAADMSPVPGHAAWKIDRILTPDEFDPGNASPLLQPGLNVHNGDYIVAVNGVAVSPDQDIQALLAGTAGQVTAITVNTAPGSSGARVIRIRPLGSEFGARYDDWEMHQRAYVNKLSGGKIGYLHIRDMENQGITDFARRYYGYLNRDGIIYDVRYNGGGFVSSMLLLQMANKPYSYFKPRYGVSWTRQDWGFPGYSVAMCNENSASNAEEFSDAFQRLKVGPVVGERTWGGEVGSGGGWHLIDGGVINVPNYGEWTPDGHWDIEGHGVIPDYQIAEDPAKMMAGDDPQLDKAVGIIMAEIRAHPVPRPHHPPFPLKAKTGSWIKD